jgi:hypothetical protein
MSRTPDTREAAPLAPFDLGPMPAGRAMTTVDEQLVRAPLPVIFELARDVEGWPRHLPHYRFVRFTRRAEDGGGIVEMSANRPFGPLNWPTFWRSQMSVLGDPARPGAGTVAPLVRFRHIGGITTGMDVAWEFHAAAGGTLVRIVHVWDGPSLPLLTPIGVTRLAATMVIGPVFVHGIASRTLAGLAGAAERRAHREHP